MNSTIVEGVENHFDLGVILFIFHGHARKTTVLHFRSQ